MNKYSFIPFLGFLIMLTSFGMIRAQGNETLEERFKYTGRLNSGLITRSNSETSGTPYLNNKFVKGVLMINSATNSQTVYLRYNMEKDQVELLRNNKVLIANSKKIQGFKLHAKGNDIVFKSGYHTNVDHINSKTFLRTAYKGTDLKLLVLHRAHLLKDIASYGSASKQNRYTYQRKYYLKTKESRFHRLKSKEDVLETLSDQKNKIEEYAHSNDLDFKKESDLIKILKYYSRLHQEMSK